MRIGVDGSSIISKKTGIGSFASYLVDSLKKAAPDIEFALYGPEGGVDLNTPRRMLWEAFELPGKARKDGAKLLYSPGFSPPPSGGIRKVATVHDLIGLIHPGNNAGLASRFYWSRWLAGNLKSADRLIASSESTRRDIRRFLGIPQERVNVVPLAVKPEFRKIGDEKSLNATLLKYNIREPFLISVSTLEPRKNHLRLLQACERLFKFERDLSVVIVGKAGGAEVPLKRFIAEKELGERVKLLGYVPEEELIHLYNKALGYAMVSLYEGFGLPVLEAMNCGLTGVVADNSSLPEVSGDTAWAVKPEDTEAIYGALRDLCVDAPARKTRAEAAYARSKQFSIAQTAGHMISIFRQEAEKAK